MNGKGDRNRSISKNYSANYDKINWQDSIVVSYCRGTACPVALDCIHFFSKNYSDEILSPFNFIEGNCELFISKNCIEALLELSK